MLYTNIYFYITILVSLIISLIFIRHYTRFLGYTTLFTIFLFSSLVFWSDRLIINIIQIAFTLISIILYKFIGNNFTYDFNGKILSFTYIFHSIFKPTPQRDNRIIGRVMPYNNYQLKYNGDYIVAGEVACAGITMISGSTGSGKTYGISSFIRQDVENGKPIVFAEYKGNVDVLDELKEFAESYGYEIYDLSNGKVNFNYDPLQNINNAGRIEAIINMRKWSLDGSDAHYRTSTQLLLQKLVGDFSHIYDSNKFKNKLNYTFDFFKYVKEYRAVREEWDAYSTVSKLLELLITSSLKDMFTSRCDKTFSFKEMKNKKFLLIVSFLSSNKELATSFSSLLFKDMLDTFTLNPPDKNLSLYADEFGTLTNPFIIKDVLEKGRSGKIATTLSLLDINQIVIETNEAYLNSLLGIINTFIIYNGATRNTAEKFAGVQLLDIEGVLMNLRKPINGKSPTAIYISKYPSLNKKINSEVFRFEPYIYKPGGIKKLVKEKSSQLGNFDDVNESENIVIEEPNNVQIKNDFNKNDQLKINKNQKEVNDSVDYNDFI